ncbi:MAG: VOC family protein [Pyrinomonadaceae bacterium]
MASYHPYLNFAGNAEEAFNFYKSVFGGVFSTVMRFGDMPGCDEMQLSDADKGKIAHISLPLENGTMLMASDSLESMGQKLNVGNNTYTCIVSDSREDADRLFNGLSADGKVEMPMSDMPWGAYWGSFSDKFGVQWMINHDNK